MIDEKRARSVHSSTESVFLKVSIVNQLEGDVLSVISTFARGVVPSVMAIHPNSSAFLAMGLGTADTANINWSLLFQGLGELQMRSTEFVDALVKAGVQRFDCHWVRSNSERLLQEPRSLLDKAETVTLTFTVSDVVQCMDELEVFKLPPTLVHGDFHLGNIGKQSEAGYGIFDWGSACIGVPLCDMAVMTKLSGFDFDDEEDWRSGYLSVWEGKIGERDLDRAMDLSLVYYWFLNLESLLALVKAVAIVDNNCVKKLVSDTLKNLNEAMQQCYKAIES